MTIEQIENVALSLEETERLQLAHRLLSSVEPGGDSEEEIERLWLEEALQRKAEIESGAVETLPAGEVFQEIRAELGRRRSRR